jgi:ADP-ribosylglycohydrolase
MIQRFRGAVVGLATGDAVGTTLEFKAPGTFRPITDMTGGGPFSLAPGQWTDDTSMAMCLAESLVACQGFDAADQMDRYLRWYHDGYWSSNGRCFDIGNTVLAALARYERTGDPFSGATNPRSAGNGSLMRLAPVVLYHAHSGAEAIDRAAESSRTTHGTAAAVDACRYMAALILGALTGESKEDLLAEGYWPLFSSDPGAELVPEIAEIARGSFKRRQPPQIKGSGYVVRSLEAALWAFYYGDDFRSGCLMAANLGDDADTTAAIFGQLAGAYFGEEGIPLEWRQRLARYREIATIAESLYEAASAKGGPAQAAKV